jgi:hypothetical protein
LKRFGRATEFQIATFQQKVEFLGNAGMRMRSGRRFRELGLRENVSSI